MGRGGDAITARGLVESFGARQDQLRPSRRRHRAV